MTEVAHILKLYHCQTGKQDCDELSALELDTSLEHRHRFIRHWVSKISGAFESIADFGRSAFDAISKGAKSMLQFLKENPNIIDLAKKARDVVTEMFNGNFPINPKDILDHLDFRNLCRPIGNLCRKGCDMTRVVVEYALAAKQQAEYLSGLITSFFQNVLDFLGDLSGISASITLQGRFMDKPRAGGLFFPAPPVSHVSGRVKFPGGEISLNFDLKNYGSRFDFTQQIIKEIESKIEKLLSSSAQVIIDKF
eukprot:TRINITY_DN2172_c0_g1_i14.p1 TRINITY_DN2172_c0_g1~~TRINITY_DN2172_c0_g1_i14.p1  ORF type:complete len:252 (+),score=50.75 TRINITY_DN2172_c0_g1_i14:94-849(+)